MNTRYRILYIALLSALPGIAVLAQEYPSGVHLPKTKAGDYTHRAPSIEALLADENIKPQLKSVILKGYDLFMNTQQLRGKYVFNDLNCTNCHLGGGRIAWSGPVWPAVTTLPDYRGKNDHVNSLAERLAGCFTYSMNGVAPEYGSDTMLALEAYHQWLAKGAPIYDERKITGRGYRGVEKPAKAPDYKRGEAVFVENCTYCHGADGQGKTVNGQRVFPPLWGDGSYNWGAGMARLGTAASFIKWNMPFSLPGKLSDQEAWDVAYYINAHERPQDPRFTGDVHETRDKFAGHKRTLYGQKINGVLLGEKSSLGGRPMLKAPSLRPRHFEDGSDRILTGKAAQADQQQ